MQARVSAMAVSERRSDRRKVRKSGMTKSTATVLDFQLQMWTHTSL
eukprot:COSAG02_NODE_35691_length_465_cov_0.549180_1_plen_45_part_10